MGTQRTLGHMAETADGIDRTKRVDPASLGGMTMRSEPHVGTMRTSEKPVMNRADSTMRADGIVALGEDARNDFFMLKGVKYKNVQCLSDNSGEAQVFLVEGEEGQRQF